MQQSLGEVLRQVRRQRNLTQKDLAGNRFSKSYVSAVEHDRIKPSPEALHFFAEQLGQPNGMFAAFLKQSEAVKALTVLHTPAETTSHIKRDETVTLLEALLNQVDVAHLSPRHDLPLLALDVLASFPPHMQASYHFLMGLNAKERGDLSVALDAFESALVFALAHQQAAILDEIGSTYLLMQAPLTALGHHLHALHLLSKTSHNPSSASLHFRIELHGGDAYRHLGAYRPALEHYERAHKHLKAQHDLATAGQLFSGLGYCIYAAIYPTAAQSISSARESVVTPEHIERELQKAISFLLQSRSLYQVCGDPLRETNVRLTLASIFLDWSTWRGRMAYEGAWDTEEKESFTNCIALLDDAEEQCRHVLLGWQGPGEQAPTPAELDPMLYAALASLIRISVQRAILARLEGSYIDIAYRERAFAASLCQQVLDTLSRPSFPWTVIQQAVQVSAETAAYRSPTLPRDTALPLEGGVSSSPHSALSLVEIYFAAGEVAEELGRAATMQPYARDCYIQANQYFQAALSMAHSALIEKRQDPGYLARLYQRCADLLEERAFASPAFYEETTKIFLGVLTNGFCQLQSLLPDKKIWHMQGNDERTTESH